MVLSKSTEVYILSGFLGCGKSTLLTRLIQNEQLKGRKIAVIMNELGEVSIDSSFIPDGLPLRKLLDGCICCTLQGDLSSQIEQLMDEYEPEAIYIESTGVAQPLDILDACTDPTIAGRIEIRSVITVVDAKQWDERSYLSAEIQKLLEAQVKYADVIVLNKIDTLAEQSHVEQLRENLLQFNPTSLLLIAKHSSIDPDVIRASRRFQQTKGPDDKLHVHHHLHLHSFTFHPEKSIDRQSFEQWLGGVSEQLYRAKGYVHLEGEPGLYLFQYSYEQAIFTRFLIDMPYEPVLVFIGEGLSPDKMKAELLAL